MKHTDPKAKTLKLTLSKEPFEVMVTGEKNKEFRTDSNWIRSRLYTEHEDGYEEREYDFVKFTNGYGADKPYFIARWDASEDLDFQNKHFPEYKLAYSNGMEILVSDYDHVIHLGEIVERGNLK